MFKFKTLWVSVDQWLPISMFSSRHKLSIFHFFQLRHQEPRRVTSRLQHFVQLGQVPGEKTTWGNSSRNVAFWHFRKGMLRKKNRIRSSTRSARTEVEAINFLDFVQLWFLQLGRTIFDQKKAFFTRDQGGLETWRHGTSPGNPYASPTIHRASKKMLM